MSGLAEKLGAKLVNSMPAITRGLKLSPFWSTTGATIYIKELDIIYLLSDDRIVEPSIKSVVHEETSQYQKIQILDTVEFGR